MRSRLIIRHCRHAMIQLVWPFAWVSIGIHIDPKATWSSRHQKYFGPYIDLHLLFFIVSFGYNCYLGQDDDIRGRGGVY